MIEFSPKEVRDFLKSKGHVKIEASPSAALCSIADEFFRLTDGLSQPVRNYWIDRLLAAGTTLEIVVSSIPMATRNPSEEMLQVMEALRHDPRSPAGAVVLPVPPAPDADAAAADTEPMKKAVNVH